MEANEAIRNAGRDPGRRRSLIALFIIFDLALAVVAAVYWFGPFREARPAAFSGEQALVHVEAQVALGPRITGTEGNLAGGDYILRQLQAAGWAAEFQPFEYQGTAARNVIGRANVGKGPVIILGAHYDTRRRADEDASDPTAPTPGANDGASGVAVLLELARTLDLEAIPNEIWLAFFDAEDNGNLDGWDWIAGSRYMASQLTEPLPQAMILFDMIGDADQQIYIDTNSDAGLSAALWQTAAQLGYSRQFIPLPRYAMLDDHTPFAELGIPAVDIIDFDYPYWHTTQDTPDKLSAASLERAGRTVETYLESRSP